MGRENLKRKFVFSHLISFENNFPFRFSREFSCSALSFVYLSSAEWWSEVKPPDLFMFVLIVSWLTHLSNSKQRVFLQPNVRKFVGFALSTSKRWGCLRLRSSDMKFSSRMNCFLECYKSRLNCCFNSSSRKFIKSSSSRLSCQRVTPSANFPAKQTFCAQFLNLRTRWKFSRFQHVGMERRNH